MLQGQLVGVLEGPDLDRLHLRQTEEQEDGLLEPQVDDHLVACRIDLGDPGLPRVEKLHRLADRAQRLRVPGAELVPALPVLGDLRLEVGHDRGGYRRRLTTPRPPHATGHGPSAPEQRRRDRVHAAVGRARVAGHAERN